MRGSHSRSQTLSGEVHQLCRRTHDVADGRKQLRLAEITLPFLLQVARLEQVLGGVSSMPETSQDHYWRSMHSSVALELRHQRRKMAAGTSFQRAMEGILAHFWAHVESDTCCKVAIMQ